MSKLGMPKTNGRGRTAFMVGGKESHSTPRKTLKVDRREAHAKRIVKGLGYEFPAENRPNGDPAVKLNPDWLGKGKK